MKSLLSNIVSIVLIMISILLIPIYQNAGITKRNDYANMQSAMRTFLDQAIDTKRVSDDMLNDLILATTACSTPFELKLTRGTPVANPVAKSKTADVIEPYEIKTVYVTRDFLDGGSLNTGDQLILEAIPKAPNAGLIFSEAIFGIKSSHPDIRFSAMVR